MKRYQVDSHWLLSRRLSVNHAFRELNRGRLSSSFSRRPFFVLLSTDIVRPRLSTNVRDTTKVIAAREINSIGFRHEDTSNMIAIIEKKKKNDIEDLN